MITYVYKNKRYVRHYLHIQCYSFIWYLVWKDISGNIFRSQRHNHSWVCFEIKNSSMKISMTSWLLSCWALYARWLLSAAAVAAAELNCRSWGWWLNCSWRSNCPSVKPTTQQQLFWEFAPVARDLAKGSPSKSYFWSNCPGHFPRLKVASPTPIEISTKSVCPEQFRKQVCLKRYIQLKNIPTDWKVRYFKIDY